MIGICGKISDFHGHEDMATYVSLYNEILCSEAIPVEYRSSE